MKVSDAYLEDIAKTLRLDEDYDPEELQKIKDAAIGYMVSYTGQTLEYMDEHPEFYHALMVLCQDFYDNRSYMQDKTATNKIVDSLLFMHRNNFL